MWPGAAAVAGPGAGLSAGAGGAGGAAEAAGGQLGGGRRPDGPPVPLPAAGGRGAGPQQTAHRPAGQEEPAGGSDTSHYLGYYLGLNHDSMFVLEELRLYGRIYEIIFIMELIQYLKCICICIYLLIYFVFLF